MARLYYLLNVARHRLAKRANSLCEEQLGVSAAQLGALLFIGENPNLQQNTLADGLSCNKSAVTVLTERLRERGLIERNPCLQDGRVIRLRLTAKGRRVVAKGRSTIEQVQGQLTDGFSEAEMKTVVRFLTATIERS